MNFGGHLEKFGGQNPQNSKKQDGHGKPGWGGVGGGGVYNAIQLISQSIIDQFINLFPNSPF